MKVMIRVATGVCVAVLCGVPGVARVYAGTQVPSAPTESAAIAQFNKSVQAYADLHRKLEGPVPTVSVSNDMAEIRAAMAALAKKIRAARPQARRGDVFTPPVTAEFRKLIREGCGGSYKELLEIVNEESDPNVKTPKVNDPWPEGAAFSMIPPQVLCRLPVLPPELEYRFVNRDLVLRDLHADIVVDVLVNAVPPHAQE